MNPMDGRIERWTYALGAFLGAIVVGGVVLFFVNETAAIWAATGVVIGFFIGWLIGNYIQARREKDSENGSD